MTNNDKSDRFKVLVVGVGGQGVLTVARIMGEAALLSGMNVTVGQLHGMSQRGGAVSSTVIMGPGRTAMINAGQADVVLGFEPLEVMRAIPLMSEKTNVIISKSRVVPFILAMQDKPYPDFENIMAEIEFKTSQIYPVDVTALISKTGSARSLNFLMLGALAGLGLLPFDHKILWEAVEKRIDPRFLEANRGAFNLAMESIS
ncbi:MAG: 2-oxoacid:acceptor oxidoreductase family protein [SAR324 cluster bacterium]|nr:2-oxoacid:acceptor oxidoreductase family protein [SAR324 cluster bacterium]